MRILSLLVAMLLSGISSAQNFTIKEAWFNQALTPQVQASPTFKQQYFILTPNALEQISSSDNDIQVMFVLGNENDATQDRLIKVYKAYGSPQNMIFILAEHRGYGQSTYGQSQQVPSYVTMEAAIDDYANLINHLREEIKGKWAVAGCSYGGTLAIRYAQLHPDTFDVAIASSAPIEWPAMMHEYADKVNESLDAGLLARLSEHLQDLYQDKDDQEAMRKIELIHTLIIGMTQVGTMQHLISKAKWLSYLPTSLFTWLLDNTLPQSAHNWANGQTSPIVPESPEMRNWFTWKYQQCHEKGTFMVGYPFSLTKDDYVKRCWASFGQAPNYFSEEPLSYHGALTKVNKPIIILSGGKDPWINLGVKPNHPYTNVDFIYDDNWHHCPDRDTPEASKQLMQKVRQLFDR